jgi:hypothetical protein
VRCDRRVEFLQRVQEWRDGDSLRIVRDFHAVVREDGTIALWFSGLSTLLEMRDEYR